MMVTVMRMLKELSMLYQNIAQHSLLVIMKRLMVRRNFVFFVLCYVWNENPYRKVFPLKERELFFCGFSVPTLIITGY